MKLATIRDTDKAAWADEMAEKLERHDYAGLDASGLAEEMRELSRSRYDELRSRLRILIAHLLKWAYQPENRSRSWQTTIANQRYEIADMLEESPSLVARLQPTADLDRIWYQAAHLAATETGIDFPEFPSACIWDLEKQILMPDWWPPKASE